MRIKTVRGFWSNLKRYQMSWDISKFKKYIKLCSIKLYYVILKKHHMNTIRLNITLYYVLSDVIINFIPFVFNILFLFTKSYTHQYKIWKGKYIQYCLSFTTIKNKYI